MRVLSIIAILLVGLIAVNAATYSESEYQTQFVKYMKKFHKLYDVDEFFSRYANFKASLEQIDEHNAQKLSWTMALNPHSDLSKSEFRSMKTGYVRRNPNSRRVASTFDLEVADVPASVDWRSQNAVTPVKDQGQCGSCWSFSATGSMEGAWAIAKGELISLSEQQLVDCSGKEGDDGCDGGLMDDAFQFVIDNNGICTEESYPYQGVDGTCKTTCKKVVTISSFTDVPTMNETALQLAVINQPVSIAVEADQSYWQNYEKGIVTSAGCGTNLDHGVLIVGYGTENNVDYWIVKNSWGGSWGESGYIRLIRNKDECGLAMDPSYPNVGSSVRKF